MSKLSAKFRLANIHQYRAKVKTTYMTPVSDDQADVEAIQLYVGRFLGLLARNPQFLDISKKGATPIYMNDFFIEGISPPLFRTKVRDLGTTDLNSTIDHLASLYQELEINQDWAPKPQSNTKKKIAKPNATRKSKFHRDFLPCTDKKCNSNFHTADRCYYLHPALRPELSKNKTSKKAFKTQVEHHPSDKIVSEKSVVSLVDQIAQLKAELAMKANKVLTSHINTSEIKPKIFDSGNNYSVIADIHHIDPQTHIIPTYNEDTLGTAGGNNLHVCGTGQMEQLPSVYVPDATASMVSVHQFCKQRDAVAMFLKDGAVGIKLNDKIRRYLSQIREIAKSQHFEH